MEGQRIRIMVGSWCPLNVIRDIVSTGEQDDPFYVMDLGEIVRRYRDWKKLMPRVMPFYAVKCNDDRVLLAALAALGAGFDCASKAEIQLITSLNVHPERIIYANPAKQTSHIRYASSVGVKTMTFDSEDELVKIKQHMPEAKLVIRIRCDAINVRFKLGKKYGCDPIKEAPRLLRLAATLKLEVIGVSFHVGSGINESEVYGRAIKLSRKVFDWGMAIGHRGMKLLDLGGGYPGDIGSDISEIALVVNQALTQWFPEEHVKVIAEPGRYFPTAAYTLAVMIHAKRQMSNDVHDSDIETMYYINDGIYGSFNCVYWDEPIHAELLEPNNGLLQKSCIWGPTCDSMDLVMPTVMLPPLKVGDWLVFRNMGAYSYSLTTKFNGFISAKPRPVIDSKLWNVLSDNWPENCETVLPKECTYIVKEDRRKSSNVVKVI